MTEWILAPFVGGYIAGLISGIFIFIKIHHRIRPRGVPEQSALAQNDAPGSPASDLALTESKGSQISNFVS